MSTTSWNIAKIGATDVRAVRRSFADELRRLGRSEEEICDGTIILGELLANACEHGRLPIHVELRPRGKHWHLNVKDAGLGFVRAAHVYDPSGDRGRGLQMVERLGGIISVSRGASPTIEVALPFGD